MKPKFFRLVRQMVEPNPDLRISLAAVLADPLLRAPEASPVQGKMFMPGGDLGGAAGRSASYVFNTRLLVRGVMPEAPGEGVPERVIPRRMPSIGPVASGLLRVGSRRKPLPMLSFGTEDDVD
jgi:hypothetical protein